MLAKKIAKTANDAGIHLGSFLKASKVDKSTFYKWTKGSACTDRSLKKMELLLILMEKVKLLKKELEESIGANSL
jgi:hypothetical protein